MTAKKTAPKDLPMPQEGGSYTRNPDGSLTRAGTKSAPEPNPAGTNPEE